MYVVGEADQSMEEIKTNSSIRVSDPHVQTYTHLALMRTLLFRKARHLRVRYIKNHNQTS